MPDEPGADRQHDRGARARRRARDDAAVAKGFSQEDFASLHPGGKLGKRLMRVEQLMHGGDQAPIVSASTPMPEVIYEMSSKGLGMTCVVDDEGALVGIITDGDLRRHMTGTTQPARSHAGDVMTRNPVTIRRDTLAAEALLILERRKITSIVVVNDDPASPGRRAPAPPLAHRDV